MSEDPKRPALRVLREELDDAPVARAAVEDPAPPADRGGGGAPPRQRRRDRQPGEIWPDCPVRALGVHGETFWYLDFLGQLAPVTGHTRDRMRGVFGGRSDLLDRAFPRVGKEGQLLGWNQELAATAMQRACSERGVWNAAERVRGVGAWTDPDGGLVLHCGDAVLERGRWRPPGDVDGFVYPARPPVARPAETPEPGAASELLEHLATWKWMRGDLDAALLLGWIGAAMFGGALDWRPLMWVTGDAGTGKSTLQKLVRQLMGGEGAMVSSTDASPAGIWQMLMHDALPVALDEIEPDADPRNTRTRDVIKLARQAASGGVVLRGGADHKGTEFRARSCFLFSSILVPPLLDQDISRIALMELLPLPRDLPPPTLSARRAAAIGRVLRARIAAGWPRWHETLELYRQALARAGHAARGADQFGTLLAMTDMVMHDTLPDAARCDRWAEQVAAATIQEQTDQATDWQRLANHLAGQLVDVYRSGSRKTVGRLVLEAARIETGEDANPSSAEAMLASVGMRVHGTREHARLSVANKHPGLARLFEGTHWYAGAGQTGVWVQSLRRVPGAQMTGAMRFAGVPTRAVCVPVQALLELLDHETGGEPPEPPSPDDWR